MLRERRAYGVKEGGSQVGRVAALMIGIGIAAIKNIPMFRGQFGTGENLGCDASLFDFTSLGTDLFSFRLG